MSFALSVTCQFFVFISFQPLDILLQHIMHYLYVCCILLIEECATLTLVLYIIFTGQPSFCLVHFLFIFFFFESLHLAISVLFGLMSTPLCSVYSFYFYFILPTHPNLYCAFYHHMLCLISGSFCLVLTYVMA